ncbi:MAG: electron transport complex subunit E [Clostridia bacterium]
MKNNYMKQIKEGLFEQNPVFVQLIGMCPTLATSTSLENGLGMGLAATAVLICSNAVISALRKFIPSKVRIAAYIVIIAGFVTIVDMLLAAFIPALSASLGLFIPLIVVNCIILARAEAFAAKNPVLPSAIDGLAMGLGFTFALAILSTIREILGSGSIGLIGLDLVEIFAGMGINFQPAMMMTLPAGGFLTLGCVVAVIQWLSNRKKEAK